MSKDNRDFFKTKKLWSEVKDELLGCYLVPYFTKMLSQSRPLLYIDCFSGKGRFEDGSLGSPLIALESFENSMGLSNVRSSSPKVIMKFIELNYPEELRDNIDEQFRKRCQVIPGAFEDVIIPMLEKTLGRDIAVFLYIDPYGIKSLNMKLLQYVAEHFGSAELLINFNSFGFLREACRVMKITISDQESSIFDDLEEYDRSAVESLDALNQIAGGSYWQQIVLDHWAKKIDMYQAERLFSEQYKAQLNRYYTYVLDMPIRLKAGSPPKYRMVFATNHHEGCVLMAGDMAKRTERLVIELQDRNQLSLFQQDAENQIISDELLEEKVKELLEGASGFIRLNNFLADFYNRYGVLCGLSRLSTGKKGSVLKNLEKNGYIDVNRSPAFTSTGKKSQFWTDEKDKKIWIKKRSE